MDKDAIEGLAVAEHCEPEAYRIYGVLAYISPENRERLLFLPHGQTGPALRKAVRVVKKTLYPKFYRIFKRQGRTPPLQFVDDVYAPWNHIAPEEK